MSNHPPNGEPKNPHNEVDASRLQKTVEAIAISPEAARKLVVGYCATYRKRHEKDPCDDPDAIKAIAAKIIRRYASMAATTGAVTALPGVIPGVGTAVGIVAGGLADIAAVLKIQIDMCTCLVELYQICTDEPLGPEDKKHLVYVLALGGSIEQLATRSMRPAVTKIAERLVYLYLRGPALITIKQLFRRVAIVFTQKAAAKAIPAGVGVAFAGSMNYAMTTVVGKVAVTILAKDVTSLR